MTRYTKEFREQAIKLSDEIGGQKSSRAARNYLQHAC